MQRNELRVCGMNLSSMVIFIAIAYGSMSVLEVAFSILSLTSYSHQSEVWDKLNLNEEMKTFVGQLTRDRSVEILILAIATLITSVMMIVGVRRKDPYSIVPWIVVARIDLVSIYIGFALDVFDKGDRNPAKIMSVILFILTATFFIYCVDKYLRYLRENIELKYMHLITTGKYVEMSTISNDQPPPYISRSPSFSNIPESTHGQRREGQTV